MSASLRHLIVEGDDAMSAAERSPEADAPQGCAKYRWRGSFCTQRISPVKQLAASRVAIHLPCTRRGQGRAVQKIGGSVRKLSCPRIHIDLLEACQALLPVSKAEVASPQNKRRSTGTHRKMAQRMKLSCVPGRHVPPRRSFA